MKLKITNIQMSCYTQKQEPATLQDIADKLYEDNEIAYVSLEKQYEGLKNDKITVGENTEIYTKLKEYPYEFEINSSMQLANIDESKITNGNNVNDATGTLSITTNGKYDVKNYAQVDVNIPTYKANSKLAIREKSNNIDVSEYQYVDTSSLFTADEAQTGKNIYWTEDTFIIDKAEYMYSCGYKPKAMFSYWVLKDGTTRNIWSTDGCNKIELYGTAVGYNGSCLNYCQVTNEGIIFKFPNYFMGATVKIWTIK